MFLPNGSHIFCYYNTLDCFVLGAVISGRLYCIKGDNTL